MSSSIQGKQMVQGNQTGKDIIQNQMANDPAKQPHMQAQKPSGGNDITVRCWQCGTLLGSDSTDEKIAHMKETTHTSFKTDLIIG